MNIFTQIINFSSFSGVVDWTLTHGYWVIFGAMLIEGPIVTAAAAFAVALGYFNIGIIFFLSLAGDLVADVAYYLIGYWGRATFIEKYGHFIGITKERIKKIDDLLERHAIKTLIALKLTPILPTPGLMIVGATRMPLRKFVPISMSITLPKTILFMVIGYYFGKAYDSIARYVDYGGYAIVLAILLIVIINYIYKKISLSISQKIEKI